MKLNRNIFILVLLCLAASVHCETERISPARMLWSNSKQVDSSEFVKTLSNFLQNTQKPNITNKSSQTKAKITNGKGSSTASSKTLPVYNDP